MSTWNTTSIKSAYATWVLGDYYDERSSAGISGSVKLMTGLRVCDGESGKSATEYIVLLLPTANL